MEPIALWKPSESFKNNSNLALCTAWLIQQHALHFTNYHDVWKWSVEQPAVFWKSISDYFKIKHHSPYDFIMSDDVMPHTKWFRGSTLNYAEHIFRNATDKQPAILFQSEQQALMSISWKESDSKDRRVTAVFSATGYSLPATGSPAICHVYLKQPSACWPLYLLEPSGQVALLILVQAVLSTVFSR